jgi:hypothetical protein
MLGGCIPRVLETALRNGLDEFPAVAIVGPRQCGKSTIAMELLRGRTNALRLDLERKSDLTRLVDPELYLSANRDELVCLDEIQRVPEIFLALRSVIDERRGYGQFLTLGSASRDLNRQSSESLMLPRMGPAIAGGRAS